MQVTITECRRQLGAMVRNVQTGASPIVIIAHGKPVAALISMEQLRMLWMAEDEIHKGPVDFATGRRPGVEIWRTIRGWMSTGKSRYVTEVEAIDLEVEREEAIALEKWHNSQPLKQRKARKPY